PHPLRNLRRVQLRHPIEPPPPRLLHALHHQDHIQRLKQVSVQLRLVPRILSIVSSPGNSRATSIRYSSFTRSLVLRSGIDSPSIRMLDFQSSGTSCW